MKRTAAITGIGVVAPSGMTVADHWATVTEGKNMLKEISLFDASRCATRIAGEVTDFDITGRVDGRLVVQTDRWTWMAFVAAEQALRDSGIDESVVDPYEMSVVLASSSGGNQFGQKELQRLWSQPARTVGAYQSIAWFYAATVGQLSIRHQAKGHSSVLVSESAGGLDSLGHAVRTIQRGGSMVLAGGLEAPLSPYALACQSRNGRLSTDSDPERAYRPFDADASGYVPGEGGAVLIVEELEHARARGARIYATIGGWGSTHDGSHDATDSRQYARALRLALAKAELEPGDVDLFIPDALGVPEFDRSEAAAIDDVFGARGVPVASHKSLTGRMYQGGSALDVVTAVQAIREQVLPGTTGLDRAADGCALAFVPTTTKSTVANVQIGARGFGGYNSSIVVRRHETGAA
ncbi:MAG TPA: beta-ketoacyl synthase N-terminal-like domain-containing protein [Pseudonocardiaceae bacterium]|nr:beta-ketoacyl synthase N-terminal-like domain-containing protein [Pseudonocardiaceae bacterium]